MIIKCPECSTAYNVPDSTMGAKPRKMKCAKCKHIFTIARRAERPPEGYVEFTGSEKLPPEFAFLKASVPPAPAVSAGGTFVGPPPTAPPGMSTENMMRSVVGRPAPPAHAPVRRQRPPVPEAPTTSAEKDENIAPMAPNPEPEQGSFMDGVPKEALEQAQTPAAQAAVAEMKQGGSTPIKNSLPAENMFGGGNAIAWEVEAPMELDSFAVQQHGVPVHHGHQMAGKVAFGVIVFLIFFFLFVAFRNGWSLSLSDLPEQIGFAFSGETMESIPDEAENIEAVVVSKKVLTSKLGTWLSVAGEVINNNPGSRSNIIMSGRLYDSKGELRSETRMPCGRSLDEKTIRKTAIGSIQQQFLANGTLYNCKIGPNDGRVFQLIFEDVPDDYDAGFEVKVKAVAATAP
ncbi:MAG: zinc-ribbon domain-containing protein [Deltaproteobacteria bacterium]|nr:zinc-ribbon domain-containing protein [Deltaproteobacteria bacterium]